MGGSKHNKGAARMSALRSMADYRAEVEENQRREQEVQAAAAARSLSVPPQLNQYMPGSQLAGELGAASAGAASAGAASAGAASAGAASAGAASAARHLSPWPSSSEPIEASGIAAAAAGVPVANYNDSPRHLQVGGPPPPMPAGEVRHGSQTVFNPVPGLRQVGDGGGPHVPPSTAPVASPTSREEAEIAAPWTVRPAGPYPESEIVVAPPPAHSSSEQEATAAAAAAAAAVVESVEPHSLAPPASLAAPFPSPPPVRRRASGGKAAVGKKRGTTKGPPEISAAPPGKKSKTAANDAVGGLSPAAGTSPPPTPESLATWKSVSGEVAKAVRNGNKELWAALKQSTAQIEHLRANSNRLEARVDAQGQFNERTAMAAASLRVAARSGGGSSGSRKESGSPTRKGADVYESVTAAKDGDDITPIVKSEEARVKAMALAPENDEKAASLRRPLRAAVKNRVATTTISRDVLMVADTATAINQEEVVKAFSLTPAVANSYLMNRVYFPATVKGSVPIKKRPVSVIMTTIPHTVAQLREFVLKPFFKVLGFSYNPIPVNKAKKCSKKYLFLTSYKGEKAVVAAAKNLMTRIGGGARIVKDKTAGSRYHVEMVVGHHALIASFVRNEFEIALGNRTRRRGGNGSSSYFH